MRIAIYGRHFGESSLFYVQEVLHTLRENGVEILLYESFRDFMLEYKVDVPFVKIFKDHQQLAAGADYLLSLGGDGTLLDTVTLVRDSGLPVLGINLGRLGFLASINKVDIRTAIQRLLAGEFTLDKRNLLNLQTTGDLFGELNYALNDITIQKKDRSPMIIIHAYLNGEFLNSYWTDGLIISTPTGSTAYSLSCGGPIVVPESNSFVITPISPHNLSVRPVIINDNSELVFEVDARASQFLLSLDSRTEITEVSTYIKVRKERFFMNLVRLNNESYLGTLRNKLMWGLDTRNY